MSESYTETRHLSDNYEQVPGKGVILGLKFMELCVE
jgi:hypothetical protein